MNGKEGSFDLLRDESQPPPGAKLPVDTGEQMVNLLTTLESRRVILTISN